MESQMFLNLCMVNNFDDRHNCNPIPQILIHAK